MSWSVRARMHNGRLEIDEHVDLPEGTVVELVAVSANETFRDEDRERRDAAIDAGVADLAARVVHAHDDVMAALRALRAR